MTRRGGSVTAGEMFGSAGCFSVLIALIAVWILYGEREQARILSTGRHTTVTVLSKHRDVRGKSPTVEIRIDDRPDIDPFFRLLLGKEWEQVQPGDTMRYVYDPEYPGAGILGSGDHSGIPCLLAAGSVFVVPFLAIGIVIKLRKRKATVPSTG